MISTALFIYRALWVGGGGGVGACERRSNSLMIAPNHTELIDRYHLSPGTGARFWRFCDHLFIYFMRLRNLDTK